jgi:hypothetical protein
VPVRVVAVRKVLGVQCAILRKDGRTKKEGMTREELRILTDG